jgi:hypothetical protein
MNLVENKEVMLVTEVKDSNLGDSSPMVGSKKIDSSPVIPAFQEETPTTTEPNLANTILLKME